MKKLYALRYLSALSLIGVLLFSVFPAPLTASEETTSAIQTDINEEKGKDVPKDSSLAEGPEKKAAAPKSVFRVAAGEPISQVFPDPGLAKTVADVLGKEVDEELLQSDIDDFKTLYIYQSAHVESLEGIGVLTNLETLFVIYPSSKISGLPKEIGNLTNLRYLDVADGLIPEIPKEIGNLTKLTFLNLSFNEIAEIPNEITNLTNLKSLNLSNNKIVSFPEDIYTFSMSRETHDTSKQVVKKVVDNGVVGKDLTVTLFPVLGQIPTYIKGTLVNYNLIKSDNSYSLLWIAPQNGKVTIPAEALDEPGSYTLAALTIKCDEATLSKQTLCSSRYEMSFEVLEDDSPSEEPTPTPSAPTTPTPTPTPTAPTPTTISPKKGSSHNAKTSDPLLIASVLSSAVVSLAITVMVRKKRNSF